MASGGLPPFADSATARMAMSYMGRCPSQPRHEEEVEVPLIVDPSERTIVGQRMLAEYIEPFLEPIYLTGQDTTKVFEKVSTTHLYLSPTPSDQRFQDVVSRPRTPPDNEERLLPKTIDTYYGEILEPGSYRWSEVVDCRNPHECVLAGWENRRAEQRPYSKHLATIPRREKIMNQLEQHDRFQTANTQRYAHGTLSSIETGQNDTISDSIENVDSADTQPELVDSGVPDVLDDEFLTDEEHSRPGKPTSPSLSEDHSVVLAPTLKSSLPDGDPPYKITFQYGPKSFLIFTAGEHIVRIRSTGKINVYPCDRPYTRMLFRDVVRLSRILDVAPYYSSERWSCLLDIDWIRRHLRKIIENYPLSMDHYLGIQAQSQGFINFISADTIQYACENLPPLTRHYLLRFTMNPCRSIEFNPDADCVKGEQNLSAAQFIKFVYIRGKKEQRRREDGFKAANPGKKYVAPADSPQPNDKAAFVDEWIQKEHFYVPRDHEHFGFSSKGAFAESYDLQGIVWKDRVGVEVSECRRLRDYFYMAKQRMNGPQYVYGDVQTRAQCLPDTSKRACFVPASMHTKHRAAAPAPEFRNLMVCQDQMTVLYANKGKVWSEMLYNSQRECVINLAKLTNQTLYGDRVKITTLNISQDLLRSICVTGGSKGEIAICNLTSEKPKESAQVGYATKETSTNDSVTINHIDLDFHADTVRGRPLRAVVSCNDYAIRTLDLTTSTWLSGHHPGTSQRLGYIPGTPTGFTTAWPINATRSSPDGRLRIVVGDTPDVTILNSETGFCERLLKGHRDYNITCDWSPDGTYVATSGWDRVVNIYDVRMWKIVAEFSSAVSAYHTLKFSPVGGGAKCLMCVEAADRLTVVDAVGFEKQRTNLFWGGVVGADFWPDGSGVVLANADGKLGGFMEFRRRDVDWIGMGKRVEDLSGEWCVEEERREDVRVWDAGRLGLRL